MASKQDLKLIDDIMKEDAKQKQKKHVKEMQRAFNIIKEFIIENQLIVYGGLALNNLLPEKYKFYTKDDIPDYDFYSPNGMEHSVNLANKLYIAGYKYVSVDSALHDNTYRISVNFTVVADITSLTPVFFKNILAISIAENKKLHMFSHVSHEKLLMAPIHLLKYGLYKELAQPNNIFRWRKVYDRMLIFCSYHKHPKNTGLDYYNALKSKNMHNITISNKDISILIHHVAAYVKSNEFPLIGNTAIGLHMKSKNIFKSCCRLDEFFSIFEIICKDVDKTCKEIEEIFNKCKPLFNDKWELIIDQRFYHSEILPRRNRIYIQDKNTLQKTALMTVFNSNMYCFSYTRINGYTVGGLYTILSFLYAYTLLYHVYESDKIVNMVINMIGAVEMFIKRDLKYNIKETMLTQCFGFKGTFSVIKRQHWTNTQFNYRPDKNKKVTHLKNK